MENIIKKAIEGGYNRAESFKDEFGKLYKPKDIAIFTLDPLFWQALGKACRWTEVYKNCGRKGIKRCICEYDVNMQEWKYYALRFHEINLTEGWDKAVEYLSDLTQEKK